jgi:shikimate dehydrogenase
VSIQKFGLIGQGIQFSLSPAIHKFSAETLGLEISYEIFEPSSTELGAFVSDFFGSGGKGLNVTTPFKRAAAQFVQKSATSAINTIYRDGKQIVGASTDGTGFALALKRIDKTLGDFSRILILGNGGATSSLLSHFNQLKPLPEIFIFRRSHKRDAEMLEEFPFLAGKILDLATSTVSQELSRAQDPYKDLVIQATKAPQVGDSMNQFIPVFLNFVGTFVDLVYHEPSAIFKVLEKRGSSCQDGLPMLIEQARQSQQLWWGRMGDYEAIRKHFATSIP